MRVFITGGSGFVGGQLIKMLIARGDEVLASARSTAAAQKIEALGAVAVRADLDQPQHLEEGMRGCQLVVHAAAKVDEWGDLDDFIRVNVTGTRHVLEAAKRAGVARTVHVSTEAVLLDHRPLVRVDERLPRAQRPIGHYAKTKAMAEEVVLEAVAAGQDVVIVRPRFIWGEGDTTLQPRLIEMMQTGRWRWIDHGRYRTSTCHVLNCCHGILCAAQRGQAGQIYFLTDGEDVELREFITALVATAQVSAPSASVPLWAARTLAHGAELIWRSATRTPPVTRMAIELSGREVTVDDSAARAQLGYAPIITPREGLEGLKRAWRAAQT